MPHPTQPVGTVTWPQGGEGAAELQDCLTGILNLNLPFSDTKTLESQFSKGEGFHHQLSIHTFRI